MESSYRVASAVRAEARLHDHYRACDQCQRAGYYPEPGLWTHLTARRGPGFAYGDGSASWCETGRRLYAAQTVARTFRAETGNWPLKLWNGLVSVWEVVTGH